MVSTEEEDIAEYFNLLGQDTKRKRKVNGVALAMRAQKAGLVVASVLETPGGGALLTFGRKSDAGKVDADHVETADELRALI